MGNVRSGRVALTYAVYATPAALGDPGDCDYCVRRTGIIRRTIANPLPALFSATADYRTGTESADGSCFVNQAGASCVAWPNGIQDECRIEARVSASGEVMIESDEGCSARQPMG
jgi:hypothetical protein